MRTQDFSPLYRSTIGFDGLARLFDEALRADAQSSYPPYNIELVGTDKYLITMAVAGFDRSELDIEMERNTLKIVGRKNKDGVQRNFLHKGLGTRDFEHRFQLADHVKVTNAKLDNGLLYLDLIKEIPEALKPRKITIGGDGNNDNVQLLREAS